MAKQEKKPLENKPLEDQHPEQSEQVKVDPPVVEVSETEAKYLRALADYQNLLKQTAREKLEFVKYANEGLLQELIPVYDHLKLSLQHTNGQENDWVAGVRHVVKQFQEALAVAGVSEIATVGHEFNPLLMTAIQQEETDQETADGKVAKELKPGYMLRDKVLIPAQVVVYKYQE